MVSAHEAVRTAYFWLFLSRMALLLGIDIHTDDDTSNGLFPGVCTCATVKSAGCIFDIFGPGLLDYAGMYARGLVEAIGRCLGRVNGGALFGLGLEAGCSLSLLFKL